jgi:hypothetical protein
LSFERKLWAFKALQCEHLMLEWIFWLKNPSQILLNLLKSFQNFIVLLTLISSFAFNLKLKISENDFKSHIFFTKTFFFSEITLTFFCLVWTQTVVSDQSVTIDLFVCHGGRSLFINSTLSVFFPIETFTVELEYREMKVD